MVESPIRVAMRYLRSESTPDRWQQFLDEQYEGGKKKVPNPDPDTRIDYPEVAVSTLLQKDTQFRKKLMGQYQKWKEKHDTVTPTPGVIPDELKPSGDVTDFVDHDSHTGAVIDLLNKAAEGKDIDAEVAKNFEEHLNKAKEEVNRASKRKDLPKDVMERIQETRDVVDRAQEWVSQSKNLVEGLLGGSSDRDREKVELSTSDKQRDKLFISQDDIESASKKYKQLYATTGKASTFKKKGLTKRQTDLAHFAHTQMEQPEKDLAKDAVNIGNAYASAHPDFVVDDIESAMSDLGSLSKAFREQYAFTQGYFQDKGVTHLTVYRNAEDLDVDPDDVSSWTVDPYTAVKGKGKLVSMQVPVEFVVQTGMTNPQLGMQVKIHPKGFDLQSKEVEPPAKPKRKTKKVP